MWQRSLYLQPKQVEGGVAWKEAGHGPHPGHVEGELPLHLGQRQELHYLGAEQEEAKVTALIDSYCVNWSGGSSTTLILCASATVEGTHKATF